MRLFFVFLILTFLPPVTSASTVPDDITLPDIERKTSSKELLLSPEFHPHQGTSYFDVFLGNMKLGKATIEVSREGEEYQIKVAAKTRNFITKLYKVKYRGEVKMLSDPVLPKHAAIVEQTGKRIKSFDIQFPSPNQVDVFQKDTGGGEPTTTKEKSFTSDSFVLDPFSVVYLIRSLEWKKGTAETFDVFTGKKQYELILYCSGETTLTVGKEQRKAWLIHPRTRTLDKERKLALSRWTVYLSQDSRRQILQITGHPSIGKITARMRKFENLPEK